MTVRRIEVAAGGQAEHVGGEHALPQPGADRDSVIVLDSTARSSPASRCVVVIALTRTVAFGMNTVGVSVT